MAPASTIAARFSRWLRCIWPWSKIEILPLGRAELGAYGEKVAARHLRRNGCRILARNYRGPRKGEVDIVAREGRTLLFVEVKTRAASATIRGLDAVNRDKQELIERGANSWLKRLGTRDLPWRFDVIEVSVKEGTEPQVNHIRNAF